MEARDSKVTRTKSKIPARSGRRWALGAGAKGRTKRRARGPSRAHRIDNGACAAARSGVALAMPSLGDWLADKDLADVLLDALIVRAVLGEDGTLTLVLDVGIETEGD